MGFKEIIDKIKERRDAKKELLRNADEQMRVQKIIEDRQKSSNERELERFMKEEREEQIRERLDFYRKERDEDIKFGHNPLDTKNITNHTDWEVLKEKNQFAGKGNIFSNHGSTLKDNKSILKNNLKLISSKYKL